MDVRFCEGRDHSREAALRAEDLDREVRALASATGHVCFSLTEDLHGCRTARGLQFAGSYATPAYQVCAAIPRKRAEDMLRRLAARNIMRLHR